MPTNIYDQHKAAFAQVSAYVIVGTDSKGASKAPGSRANAA